MLKALPLLATTLIALMSMMPMAAVHAMTQTFTFNNTRTFNHITLTVSGTITVDTTAKTITGTVSVTAVNDTSGQTIFQRTFTINNSFGQSASANFVLMVPTATGLLSESCMATSSAGSCIASKDPDVANQGVVNIVDLASVASAYGTANARYDLNGDGVVNILDLALVASDYGAPVIW